MSLKAPLLIQYHLHLFMRQNGCIKTDGRSLVPTNHMASGVVTPPGMHCQHGVGQFPLHPSDLLAMEGATLVRPAPLVCFNIYIYIFTSFL